jgi:hypothetical protein
MKLSKSDRGAFVRAVMDDVPQIDYDKQVTDLVHTIMREQMPPKLRAVYDDKELRPFLYHGNYHNEVRVAGVTRVNCCYPVKLSDENKTHLIELATAYKQQEDQRDELRQKLEATILTCTTLKQAKERLPEFERYLPADRDGIATANLPAVANLVGDLTKAGWPKKEEKK